MPCRARANCASKISLTGRGKLSDKLVRAILDESPDLLLVETGEGPGAFVIVSGEGAVSLAEATRAYEQNPLATTNPIPARINLKANAALMGAGGI